MSLMVIYCASGNRGKLDEFSLAAESWASDCEIEVLPNLDRLEPCDETGSTFEENAILKAACYGIHAPGLLFADDSGLEADALGGAPGVISARFSGPNATDEANNKLLLEKLRGISNRSARFVCVIALSDKGRLLRTFRDEVRGEILEQARGSRGFGYDPLFYYPPFGCSFGEISAGRKLQVSHRGRALAAMFQFLRAEL